MTYRGRGNRTSPFRKPRDRAPAHLAADKRTYGASTQMRSAAGPQPQRRPTFDLHQFSALRRVVNMEPSDAEWTARRMEMITRNLKNCAFATVLAGTTIAAAGSASATMPMSISAIKQALPSNVQEVRWGGGGWRGGGWRGGVGGWRGGVGWRGAGWRGAGWRGGWGLGAGLLAGAAVASSYYGYASYPYADDYSYGYAAYPYADDYAYGYASYPYAGGYSYAAYPAYGYGLGYRGLGWRGYGWRGGVAGLRGGYGGWRGGYGRVGRWR
jgi:hypothetical protein